jgi:hypothetical protein
MGEAARKRMEENYSSAIQNEKIDNVYEAVSAAACR